MTAGRTTPAIAGVGVAVFLFQDIQHSKNITLQDVIITRKAKEKTPDFPVGRLRWGRWTLTLACNNPVENAIRPIAIGKKNWLFAGSERAGKRAAAIQSLLGTAKLNGLEPCAWLKDTLEKLPIWPNSRIDELLPIQAS